MRICHACKRLLPDTGKISRREECPFCHSDLYCCLNCTFHDPLASKQCREPVGEMVKEKQKANYCDYFRFAESKTEDRQADEKKSRKELDDLFKR